MTSRSEPGDITVYPVGRSVWVVCSDPDRGYAVRYRMRLTPSEAMRIMSAGRVWVASWLT